MEIPFGVGSGRGNKHDLCPTVQHWNAMAESLHWWIKQDPQLTKQAWGRGYRVREEEGN